jgi:hypothetical protein
VTPLPETRGTLEQRIDVHFDLRAALLAFGALARVHETLRAADALATVLGDPGRQGRVALYMALHFIYVGAYDRSLAASERPLALATMSEDVGACTRGTVTPEQTQLFASRNNAWGSDVVVYFVRSRVPSVNGCAAHLTLAMWALALLAVLRVGAMAAETAKKSLPPPPEASSLAAFKASRGLGSR